jgi:predicted DNA-binding protein
MTNINPTSAQMLASLIKGGAKFTSVNATVQRSHRFPLHIFACLENMAEMSGAPVSVIINQVLEAGIEAVTKELPEEINAELKRVSQAQLDRPMKTVNETVKSRKDK